MIIRAIDNEEWAAGRHRVYEAITPEFPEPRIVNVSLPQDQDEVWFTDRSGNEYLFKRVPA